MPTTRLALETYLVGADLRSGMLGANMVRVGLYDPATATLGAIPALAGPISAALASLGLSVADETNPTDMDLLSVTTLQRQQLRDMARLECLDAILGNWSAPNETSGPDSQDWGSLRDGLQRDRDALRAWIMKTYRITTTASGLRKGTIDLAFTRRGRSELG